MKMYVDFKQEHFLDAGLAGSSLMSQIAKASLNNISSHIA